ncbi:hypothetical protein [Nocardiopsis metallicus]|uniref:2-polyprenyl-6-methoxyphenol hydroxylase-like FAD-dependent oxidoreductase n=1 Tax=Nocardiopsis metallicus TaxID=179819 RepID=A0A840WIH5_9ACTN|nr:hypothetical protein [Nocardiopsis metallicus]MBB5491487.1 2-polyprenyl-6-methoxyphenol hydroxylase-like FAD-dependent oxidoreductase [Nocardiopsis metallicus]
MSRIMIAGAGHAGLGLATHLVRSDADLHVDLYTIHTTEELLRAPRLTQMSFPTVYELEQNAHLDFWSGLSPVFRDISFAVSPGDGTRQSFVGQQRRVGTAIDHGAKTAAWLQQVERQDTNPGGAFIHVQTVQAQTLAWFAKSGMYDLVIVATGDSDTQLGSLFSQVSVSPTTRVIVQAHFEGAPQGPDVQVTTTPHGEIFAYPVLAAHWEPALPGQEAPAPELVPATAVQVYARAGGPMDPTTEGVTFSRRAENLSAGWAHAHRTLAEHTPELAAWAAQAPCLEQSRLLRPITPRVRRPLTQLNGTPVLGIGDVVLTVDPTSGQGANASTRVARVVADHILARLEQGKPLADAAFLEGAYQDYWDQHGQHTSVFNNLVTDFWSGKLPPYMTERFAHNFTDQDQADRMVVGWDDPSTLDWLLTP